MQDYSKLTQHELKEKLLNACRQGHHKDLQEMVANGLVENLSLNSIFYQMGLVACANGRKKIIKYLIESPELKNKINREEYISEYFKIACANDHLQVIQYLATNPNVNRKNLELLFSIGLNHAVRDGRINIVNYFFTEFKDLILNDNMVKNGAITNTACEYGELEILKYFYSMNILNKDNIHQNSDQYFLSAYENNKLEVIKYFILDLDMDKTENIKQLLSEKPNKEIDKMFNLRDLNKSLNNNLEINQPKNKKLKV